MISHQQFYKSYLIQKKRKWAWNGLAQMILIKNYLWNWLTLINNGILLIVLWWSVVGILLSFHGTSWSYTILFIYLTTIFINWVVWGKLQTSVVPINLVKLAKERHTFFFVRSWIMHSWSLGSYCNYQTMQQILKGKVGYDVSGVDESSQSCPWQK